MDVVESVGAVVIPVLAGWSAVRILLRNGTRFLDHVAALFWSGVAIGLGVTDGPAWLLPAGCVTAAATLLAQLPVLAALLAKKPLIDTEPAAFRARLLEICAAPDGPRALLAGVGPDGTITIWGLEAAGVPRDRHRPGPGCATCLLEDVVEHLADNGTETVTAYRELLHRRANQLFALRRGVIGDRWTAELRPVQGFRTPFEHSPCPVHRL